MGALRDRLRGYWQIWGLVGAEFLPFDQRGKLKIVGATVADDPVEEQTVITIDANANATVEPTPNTIAKRGTNGEGYFAFLAPTTSTNPLSGIPSSGLIRLPPAPQVVMTALDGAEGNRVKLLIRWIGNALLLGDSDVGGPTSVEISAWNGPKITLSGEGSGQPGEITESWSGGQMRRKVGAPLSTDDETPAELVSITAADNSTYVLGLDVVATGAAGSYVLTARIPVAVASGVLTATLPAAALDSLGLVSGSGGVALSWSGGLLIVTATGLPATDIAWKSRAELL